MGVDTRRHMLPAPTESNDDTTGGSATATEIATDVSRRTDKTSYSLPDDGSPITISTRRRSHHREKDEPTKLSRASHHQSQTSLLIEYFEGGKGSGTLQSRPSVRVKVTPSAARKLRDGNDHIQITESGSRKPIYTRRISLSTPSRQQQKQLPDTSGADDLSTSDGNSATEENTPVARGPPLEIEFVDRDQKSEASAHERNMRPATAASDISSMPPDSMLDGSTLTVGPRRKRSQSLGREEDREQNDLLKAPSRRRSRSLSRERIAHKVAEKLSSTPHDIPNTKHRRGSHSVSKEYLEEDTKSHRRRSHRHREEDLPPSVDSSLLSSAVSSRRKSGDRYSFHSSRSSINNPKLLETVEDAIRRLILPELKELKKDQKVTTNTSRFEREASASNGSASKDESGRRPSKHSSAPEIKKPTVVLNKDSKDEGTILSEEPSTPRKESRREEEDVESCPDSAYVKGARPELREEEKLRRQRSKGLRDAEKAGIVGNALTAAALKHHDSKSSLDRRERRKRRSKSRAASVNLTETELLFQKHNVPPMPMRSEMDSELTRDSLLSQRTEDTETSRREIRNVSRGTLRENGSQGSSTPTRSPRNVLGTHHSNFSTHDLSSHGGSSRDLRKKSRSSLDIAAAAAANLLDDHSDHDDSEPEYEERTNRRALSPIQSVASDRTEVQVEQDKNRDTSKTDSDLGLKAEQRLSIDSLSSAPSTNLAKSRRQQETRERNAHNESWAELGYEESPKPSNDENWEKESELEDETPRHSKAEPSNDDPKIDVKRMTNYTDDSLDAPYLDKVTEGQEVADGYGANPEYVHTPVAVESAVASLHEPSVLDNSFQFANRSRPDSLDRPDTDSPRSIQKTPQGFQRNDQGSPLKQRQDASSPDERSFPQRMGVTSPPQSVAQSVEDEEDEDERPHMGATGHPGAGSPMPEVEHVADDSEESEINTNPSIIQGPIGGIPHENRDHWPYNPTPPMTKDVEMSPSVGHDGEQGTPAPGTGMTGYDQSYYQPDGFDFDNFGQPRDSYMGGQMIPTPPGVKDEGYISGANPRSPSVATPEPQKGFADSGYGGLFGSADDSFGHQRHLSGYSQGIPSPFYDGATGGGVDRIQSKDIIALMEHLTVRDAQRNARDTEILVTLVRSAAEMRNSFLEMKKFIAEQDELLMEANDKHHERLHKVIGGPRPLPPSGYRARQQQQADDAEDLRTKRKNVFKRALKGLSLKSSNDLSKIEDMLEQLLDEVEALRIAQGGKPPGTAGAQSSNSSDQAQNPYQDGYEPEGQAGTSSNEDQSGYLSNSSRPAPDSRGMGGCPSTVPEADEDEVDRQEENGQHMAREERGASVPLESPPRAEVPAGSYSNDTTPKTTEKSKKHKSSSSSFFPKFSRWSKTTASSVGDTVRNTIQPGRKERPYSEASRSGSDLAPHGPYNTADYYDPQGDDRLRSTYTLDEQQRQENRPPSPLVPSMVSENPKYQAHRDSLDLKHPQPRQGPTDRYQTHLESQAQNFVPVTPNSELWGSSSSLPRMNTGNTNRYSTGSRLSPISDAGFSETGSAPPRPPKIKDEGPLVPQRPPKIKEGDTQASYVDRMTSRGSAVRASPPQRRPTGPRPITGSSGQYSPGNPRRHRYRDSPTQVDDEDN